MSEVSYTQALETITDSCRQTVIVETPVSDCLDHVLAADVVSAVHIPPFDNSAMDGFALRAVDAENASAAEPTRLKIRGVIAAGDAPLTAGFEAGCCYQIMTGAPVPVGADTIIPVELATLDGDTVTFASPQPLDKHIRHEGTDFKAGQRLFQKGQKITAQMLPALCSVGLAHVSVYQRPIALWLSTGEELTDSPGALLEPGKIFNSSGPFGAAMLPALGADLRGRATVPDDLDLFRAHLHKAAEDQIDVIVSTGAVSVGMYDFVRSELEAAGWDILLHRAKVKPGKPILFARLKAAEGEQADRFFFGLPGNPVSSAMGLRVFVAPFLRKMQGRAPEQVLKAKVQGDTRAAEGLTVFMKAVSDCDTSGQMSVTSLEAQQSYQVGAMGQMNCWLVHEEGKAEIKDGAIARFLPFYPD